MTKLYTEWAQIYHEMYDSIFDYGKDFRRFQAILEKHRRKDIVELGCGSGRLAQHFVSAGYAYRGLDVAREMIAIAGRENPGTHFVQADMRSFTLRKKADAVLIAGRSFSYMTTNQDVLAALRSIHRALSPGGLLIFDNFDARIIFRNFKKRPRDEIRKDGRGFLRRSKNSPNLATGWTWNWDADYTITDGREKQSFRDRSILRAFTPDELRLFLTLTGYETLRMSQKGATILTVARKPGSQPAV